MLNRVYEKNFHKDIKLAKKRGKNLDKLEQIINLLLEEKVLDRKYKNHKLHGNFKDHWECHIESDWLLIYRKTETDIILVRLGTHSDLF